MAKIILTESQYQRLLLEMHADMQKINAEAEKADKNPTEKQKEAGNIFFPHLS